MSQSFADSRGDAWTVEINVTQLKRVRTALDVDLLKLAEDGGLFGLADDPVTLCNLLFVLCESQAKERAVTDEQFGERLASGDVIEAAVNALLEALILFFRPSRREPMQRVLEKVRRLETMGAERAKVILDSPDMDQTLTTLLDKEEAVIREKLQELGSGFTASPESSA
jgi:hypothetical protein